MKKKMFLCAVMAALLLFSVIGCEKQPEGATLQNTESPKIEQPEPTPQEQEQQAQENKEPVFRESPTNLLEAVQQEDTFGEIYIAVDIWDYRVEQACHFDSRNSDFSELFVRYLNETELQPLGAKPFDEDAESFYFYLDDANKRPVSVKVNAKDQIAVEYYSHYESPGCYEKLVRLLTPFMEESAKYYRISRGQNFMDDYTIWDVNGKVLMEESSSREYHLYYLEEGIVHSWIQAGTGVTTRSAIFYDVINGTVSPCYTGQTHSFGRLVSYMERDAICISDMFSGEELYRIDNFEYPLASSIEPFFSAYFTNGGTQLTVTYRDNQNETHQQVFDLPEAVLEHAK